MTRLLGLPLIPVCLGDLESEHACALADLASAFGENVIRLTTRQNIAFSNIPAEYLGAIYAVVRDINDLSDQPTILGNAVACAGARTCRLGLCRSQGALIAVERRLRESDLPLEECRLTLNFLGCPNSCGAHWGADLGFSGKALRGNNTLYPGYMIVAGAKSGAVGARLARSVGEVSARDLPDAVVQILRRYLARGGAYDSFADYLDQGGEHEMRRVCQGYEQIPRIDEDRAYYTDWDSDEVFSLAGRGQGEWIVDPKYWTARAA